ncbi:MAG: hypothetical protein ACI8S6_002912, partial [Myxococcota bacterium]
GAALFWAHPEVSLGALGPTLGVLLLVTSVAVPLLGNAFPHRVSFLPSMRYYAGNWAVSVWLFKGDSHKKLQALPMSAPWIPDQLAPLYDRKTIDALLSKVMAFRLMHLHGRALGLLLPQALDGELSEHTWVDGEMIAGLILGWNFGDGHLHGEALIDVVREACGFEPGELRCICVESQSMLRRSQDWQIFDGATGRIASGTVSVDDLRARQPWDLG